MQLNLAECQPTKILVLIIQIRHTHWRFQSVKTIQSLQHKGVKVQGHDL